MKKLFLTAAYSLLIAIPNYSLAADFSAFVKDRQLYMTIPGDECNYFSGELSVEPSCRADRTTKNTAIRCRVSAYITQTELYCGDYKFYPVVVKIDLDDNNVTPEVKTLLLTFLEEEITIEI